MHIYIQLKIKTIYNITLSISKIKIIYGDCILKNKSFKKNINIM